MRSGLNDPDLVSGEESQHILTFNGTAEVPRAWTIGTLCGMAMDDQSHAACP